MHFGENMKEKIKRFFKNIWEECKDVKTLIILLIVILIVYSPVWGGYLLYFIFKLNIFLVVATACAAFWAGPFTPFFPLCIAITLAIKKLLKRKNRKNPENKDKEEEKNTSI